MRIKVVGKAEFRASLGREQRKVHDAMLAAVAGRTRARQMIVRHHVNRAFPGSRIVRGGNRRVANAIRSAVYDNGWHDVAGLIWSKFGRGRGPSFVDFVLPQLIGGTIRPKGKYLIIPLAAAGRRSLKLVQSLSELEASLKLDRVPLHDGRYLLVDRRTREPWFLAVRQVRRRGVIVRSQLLEGEGDALRAAVIREYIARVREKRG